MAKGLELLPDSTTDEPNSHGYVNFTAHLDQTRFIKDTAKNRADIYFDFQAEVRTNTSKVYVDGNVSINEEVIRNPTVRIYPNPTNEAIFIENNNTHEISATITDMQGKIIDELIIGKEQKIVYHIEALTSGVYILSTNNEAYRFIVIE